ncbi:hypothetical protein ACJMK2_042344 [Sinanodonta woodiana]|uniref:Uncharacterized protein n=1 Tax=Sinanodonta woodiana TaxID=1069815 RepID=A0ABD3W725_SINWO
MMANIISSISMDSTPEFKCQNLDVLPGWNNLQARRRRNALGHIFLDQGLLSVTPLTAAFSSERLDNRKQYLIERVDESDDGADNGQEEQVHLWRQTVRQGRRNGEYNIFSYAEKVQTTK